MSLVASRSLDDLHPHMRVLARQLIANAAAAGILLTVTGTLRSMAVQAGLYALGRTAPGRIVTDAKPGYSYHNFGLAIDVVPTALIALPDWGDTPADQGVTTAVWAKLGAIGKELGLRWGGEFPHLPDRPHFEWSGGLTLAQLRRGARPGATARHGSGSATSYHA